MDNDGQWSQPYPFTIVIREVRRVFYVKDHLGNIRQSLNETGTVVSAQDYYPYGEVIRGYIQGHPYEKYRFTEKERDIETNLDYFGARYYDGKLGIWYQVDPLWEKYRGLSPYNYTLNNPLRFIDPKGLSPELDRMQQRYEEMMERERQRHGGSYSAENSGGGDKGLGSFLLNLFGLKQAGPKYTQKSEDEVQDEIIINQGITNQEKANMQFTVNEVYLTSNAKGGLIILGLYVGAVGLGAEGILQTTLFGTMSLVPSFALDYMNGATIHNWVLPVQGYRSVFH